MDEFGARLVLILAVGLVLGLFRALSYIGSSGERSARELHERALMRQQQQKAVEDVAATCERRAAELIAEFPTLGDIEIATLMHDELTNMRSPHRVFYDWAHPANVARIRRTMAVQAIRAQRSSGDVDIDV